MHVYMHHAGFSVATAMSFKDVDKGTSWPQLISCKVFVAIASRLECCLKQLLIDLALFKAQLRCFCLAIKYTQLYLHTLLKNL